MPTIHSYSEKLFRDVPPMVTFCRTPFTIELLSYVCLLIGSRMSYSEWEANLSHGIY